MGKLGSVKVDIDLIEEAMRVTGITASRRAVVEEALKTLVRLQKEERESTEGQVSAQQAQSEDKVKVMIVDDEAGSRQALRMILKNRYDVVTADDPLKALEDLAVHPVDIVITDVRMPQMSGLEVLKKVKEISPGTEVILVTAYASFATAQEALKHEASDYLLKPFGREEVEDAVEKALARHTQKRVD